jgi:hypothetical protein
LLASFERLADLAAHGQTRVVVVDCAAASPPRVCRRRNAELT